MNSPHRRAYFLERKLHNNKLPHNNSVQCSMDPPFQYLKFSLIIFKNVSVCVPASIACVKNPIQPPFHDRQTYFCAHRVSVQRNMGGGGDALPLSAVRSSENG